MALLVSDVKPLSFIDFCNLETVVYFKDQLKTSKRLNVEEKFVCGFSPTQRLYLYQLHQFNTWICGKKFTFKRMIQTGTDIFKREDQTIKLANVEQFLKLYQQSTNSASDYIKVVKKFLLDDIHKGKKAKTIRILYFCIRAYFEKNDTPIVFKFDPKLRSIGTIDFIKNRLQ